MRSETLGDLRCKITGGTDGNGSGDGPVIVLLHGFGAPGDDLVALWREVDAPRGTRWVFPAAPIALSGYGFMSDARAWWEIDLPKLMAERMAGRSNELAKNVPDGLIEAREKVTAMLDAHKTLLGVQESKLVLGGFSQGAMLACDTVLHHEALYAGLALLSGTFIAENQWREKLATRAKVPVFQSHGTHDPILPFDQAERLHKAFVAADWPAEFVSFRGEHTITRAVLDGLGRFCTKVL
jgi:phospholipase/carboxylesterase